tara:strand:+ start:410 stop:634 length:225 start_codon:yes stop_codon:yes gene_type:complete
VINVTSNERDITGQARKMGRTAGLKSDGTLDSVHSHSGTEYKEGTLAARTLNPDTPADKLNTDRSKSNKTGKSY